MRGLFSFGNAGHEGSKYDDRNCEDLKKSSKILKTTLYTMRNRSLAQSGDNIVYYMFRSCVADGS